MSKPQTPKPQPAGKAGVNPKFFVWFEEIGVVDEIQSIEEYVENYIRLDSLTSTMKDLLERVFPWKEGIKVEEIKKNGKELVVKYKYEDEGVEKSAVIHILYTLTEIDDQVGYWNNIMEDVKKSKLTGKITRGWRLERIIYYLNRKGDRVYFDDPSTVVIVEVVEE